MIYREVDLLVHVMYFLNVITLLHAQTCMYACPF